MLGRRSAAVPAVREVGEHVLRAIGVSKRIDEAVLLLPTDVELGTAECVVLRGPNGSGKTTLLRILAGILPPSEGQATLDGSTVDERHDRTRSATPRHGDAARQLGTLLRRMTRVGAGHTPAWQEDLTEAQRAGDALLTAARAV